MIFYRWLELIKVHARPQTKLTKALIWKYDYHHYATHSLSPDRHKGLPWHSSQLNWLIVGAGASGVVLELVSHNDWAWDALTFRETFTAWQLAGVIITIERRSVTGKHFYKH